MIDRGYLSYLAFIWNIINEQPHIDSLPMVREFINVFITNLLGVSPNKNIDISIDYELGTKTISSPPCCMTLSYLNELNDQLKKLLSNGFILPIFSLWFSLIVFVRKKEWNHEDM